MLGLPLSVLYEKASNVISNSSAFGAKHCFRLAVTISEQIWEPTWLLDTSPERFGSYGALIFPRKTVGEEKLWGLIPVDAALVWNVLFINSSCLGHNCFN
jgi:hypothetical protein